MDTAYDFERDDYEDDAGDAPPPVIGGHERRLHVRAYEYWLSLLNGRPCPSVQDLDPASIAAFGGNSVLLDFSRDVQNPTVTYLGRQLREECGMLHGIRTIADVPPRSLLSRLTDHSLQILANKTPIGFEAEFTNHKGLPTLYRGILMPFASHGDTIDYVYGVINWKHAASDALSVELEREMAGALQPATAPILPEINATEPEPAVVEAAQADASLHHWLAAARVGAEKAQHFGDRAHSALYAAISQAYDFALAAETLADDYAALLTSEGLTVQARAPMTPIVKLVFGADYDKTRVTEYAAALSYARHENIGRGELAAFLDSFEGGLKGIVRAERARRAPTDKPSRADKARNVLRSAPSLATVEMETGADEFVVLLARRTEAGRVSIIGALDDAALLERAIRKAAA
jgi:hypothetical protein